MEVVIYPLWCVVGPPFISQRDPPWVAWFFCGQEAKKSLESSPFVSLLDGLEGKK